MAYTVDCLAAAASKDFLVTMRKNSTNGTNGTEVTAQYISSDINATNVVATQAKIGDDYISVWVNCNESGADAVGNSAGSASCFSGVFLWE